VKDLKPIQIRVLYHKKVHWQGECLIESEQSMPNKPTACLTINAIAMTTILYKLSCIRIYAFLLYQ
jgi:hypothetical protein